MSPADEVKADQDAQSVAVDETPASGAAGAEAPAAGDAGTAQDAAAAAESGPTEEKSAVKKAEFQEVESSKPSGEKPGLDLLLNVTLPVSVELGRATMTIKEVLGIYEGAVIELDRAAGEPIDILVSGKLLGRGEVVVVDDKFGVRITELINTLEGIDQ